MCGIAGFLSAPGPAPLDRAVLIRMTDALAHRGPDDRGFYLDDRAGLGHARLSIIDLTGGRQPLSNEDGSVHLVCNGEIYNYRELRLELEADGHRFSTNSDCETLVHLWESKGESMLEPLRGMYAFALYDAKRRILFGARDRFGQKPLFYFWDENQFIFASEIKALLQAPNIPRRLNARALDQFLFYQFVPHPGTLLERIFQVPAASWFKLENQRLTLNRYWNTESDIIQNRGDETDLDAIEKVLDESVGAHMVSDVPVGVLLSGGIDSSLVASMAARRSDPPLRSFSIAFPGEAYDESEFAAQAASHLGLRHQSYPFRSGDLMDWMKRVADVYDHPIADPAALPLMALSERVSREVKVVLTGDGGDELFAGYDKYRRAFRFPRWRTLGFRFLSEWLDPSELARAARDPWKLRKLRTKLARALSPDFECRYYPHLWQGWHRSGLYRDAFRRQTDEGFRALDLETTLEGKRPDFLRTMLELDRLWYLPDNLLIKTDYATMAFGLESRAPFLDQHVASSARRLRLDMLTAAGETKTALRRIAQRRLPEPLAVRRKRGFTVPIAGWFRSELKDWLRRELLAPSAAIHAYFNRHYVEQVLSEHAEGRANHAHRIYSLLVFALWHRRYME